MLRIAVTGPVGSGKSTLIARLAAWAAARGRSVDGFVAHAGGQRHPGADRYTLTFLDGTAPVLLAERTGAPVPYVFHDAGWAAARAWSERLAERPRAWLVALDEFGKLEARGEGLMPLWPAVEAAGPALAVVAVRDGAVAQVEAHMGTSFDRVVRTDAPGAEEELRRLALEHDDWARVGVYGAGAGGIEMSIGSILHGARVPLRGLAMSSTQAAVMTEAARGLGRRTRVVWVPFLAAGLKALSPAGSRLRPMLAITAQGLLYATALRVLGWNAVGVLVGGGLVGTWAALQGVAMQWLLVGDDLFRAYDVVAGFAARTVGVGLPGLVVMIAFLAAGWAAVAGGIAWSVYRRRRLPRRVAAALERAPAALPEPRRHDRRAALRAGALDLLRPTFWIPVVLVLALLAAAGTSAEGLLWTAARAATVGFLVLVLARLVAPAALLQRLRRRGIWGPAIAMAEALDRRGGAEKR